jgi:uridine kinase
MPSEPMSSSTPRKASSEASVLPQLSHGGDAPSTDLPRRAEARGTAQVTFADGRVYEAPLWTPLEDYVRAAGEERPWPMPIVAALIDDELRELTYHIERDVEVKPLGMDDRDGSRIYRRSLTFLLVVAARELFPEASLHVDHSVTFGGYYCEVQGRPPFTTEELAAIETRMREIAAVAAPIHKERVPLEQAIEFFRAQEDAELVRLLSHRHHKDYLVLYTLRDVRSYFHGYMVPSADYLKHFGLYHYPPGFILRFPPRTGLDLEPVVDYPSLVTVFREYGKTLRLLGVENVGALDEAVESGRTNEIILVAEALHEQRIAQIATQIAERARQGTERARWSAGQGDGVRLVLIAGPSASGKTTFSKRLAVQLLANGIRPIAVELDSYFVDRELTPRDAQGNFDFEMLEALDLPLLNRQLLQLMAGEEVALPRFDFVTGVRAPGATIQLGPDQVLIVEGIHGLNPRLTPNIPPERIFRVYASALTQLNIDRYNRVPTTDTRLLRRIVRDARTRGYSAADTIMRWESVHRGEREHIFPFQENADAMFNSALVYELGVLKPFAEPRLLQIEPGKPGYIEAKRLLAFLAWFEPIPTDPIPDNSILREFVGGSNLEKFEPWRKG